MRRPGRSRRRSARRRRAVRRPSSASRSTLDEHAVGLLGGGAAAQHDRVAALERERGDVDRDVGTGLVDGADDAERHAHLVDAHAVRQACGRCTVSPIGSVRRDDLEHGVGQRVDAALVEREPVEQAGGQPDARAPASRSSSFAAMIVGGALAEERRDLLERGILLGRRRAREAVRRLLRGGEARVDHGRVEVGLLHGTSLGERGSVARPCDGRGSRASNQVPTSRARRAPRRRAASP